MQAKPIFPDINVGPQNYTSLGENVLLVTKVFPTIQGEGPFAGRRCVFIRLAGCNLGGKSVSGPGCSFCDTDFRFDQGTKMTFEDVINRVYETYPASISRSYLIVITGGEPMIQPNLVSFIKRAPVGWNFQIESNGRQLLRDFPNAPVLRPYLVVSPKISELEARNRRTASRPVYPIPSSEVMARADCLKFVVSADSKSPYHNIPEWADEFIGSVYVSPMAIYREGVTSPNKAVVSIWDKKVFDQQACAGNHAHAAKIAMQRGFIMTVQMHLYASVE